MMLAGKTLSEQPLSVQPFLTCLHTAANHRTEVGRGGGTNGKTQDPGILMAKEDVVFISHLFLVAVCCYFSEHRCLRDMAFV